MEEGERRQQRGIGKESRHTLECNDCVLVVDQRHQQHTQCQ